MDFIKQLKEQINIAAVVGEYVRLRKTGSNYMGLCPFHAERSPSFSVTEKRQVYHCFGCQKSGDVISFVQEIQAVSFQEAVRLLASKFGIQLPPEFRARGGQDASKAAQDKLEVFFKLNRFVAQFYHERLLAPEGKAAREYLAARGVSEDTIKNAYLGYAPAGWSEVYDFLESKKAPLDKAEELGLIRRKEQADSTGRAHYDLFRDRVMFPVSDLRGRVIAFGGRAMGDEGGPKYLNSSESPVFKKGSHLFGIFYAQKEIRAEDRCVVVEGFMDCLALQQAGVGYSVATLGTAMTERQVAILKRFTKNIVLLFDGDSAGREAQARAMEIFLEADVVVRGVTLPDELDPDEFVRERGVEALKQLLENAPYLLDQRVLELAAEARGHAEGRAQAVEQLLPLVAKIGADTSRLVRLQEIAGLFDQKIETLERRIAELRGARASSSKNDRRPEQPRVVVSTNRGSARPAPAAKPGPAPKIDALDAKLLEGLVVHPGLFASEPARDDVLDGLESRSTRDLATRFFAAIGSPLGAEALDWTESGEYRAVIGRALVLAERAQDVPATDESRTVLEREAKDLLTKLVRRGLERRKEGLRAVVLKAGGAGQSEEFSRLMAEYNELVRRLDETKSKEVR